MQESVVAAARLIAASNASSAECAACFEAVDCASKKHSLNGLSFGLLIIEEMLRVADLDKTNFSAFFKYCVKSRPESSISEAIVLSAEIFYSKLAADEFEALFALFFTPLNHLCWPAANCLISLYMSKKDMRICQLLYAKLNAFKSSLFVVQILDFLVAVSFDAAKLIVGAFVHTDCVIWHRWRRIFSKRAFGCENELLLVLECASFKILRDEDLDCGQKACLLSSLLADFEISELHSANIAAAYIALRSLNPERLSCVTICLKETPELAQQQFASKCAESFTRDFSQNWLFVASTGNFFFDQTYQKKFPLECRVFFFAKAVINGKNHSPAYFCLETAPVSEVLACLFEAGVLSACDLWDVRRFAEGQSKSVLENWTSLIHAVFNEKPWLVLSFIFDLFKLKGDSQLFMKYTRYFVTKLTYPEELFLLSKMLLFYAGEPRSNVDEFLEVVLMLFCKIAAMREAKQPVFRATVLNLMQLFELLFKNFELIDFVSLSELLCELQDYDAECDLLSLEHKRIRCELIGPLLDRPFKSPEYSLLLDERNRLFNDCIFSSPQSKFLKYFSYEEMKGFLDADFLQTTSLVALPYDTIVWLIDAEISEMHSKGSFIKQDSNILDLKKVILDYVKSESVYVHNLLLNNSFEESISAELESLLSTKCTYVAWFLKLQYAKLLSLKYYSTIAFFIKKLSKMPNFSLSSLLTESWKKIYDAFLMKNANASSQRTNASILLGAHVGLYQKHFAHGHEDLLQSACNLMENHQKLAEDDSLGFFVLSLVNVKPNVSSKSLMSRFVNSRTAQSGDIFNELCIGMLCECHGLFSPLKIAKYRFLYHLFYENRFDFSKIDSREFEDVDLPYIKMFFEPSKSIHDDSIFCLSSFNLLTSLSVSNCTTADFDAVTNFIKKSKKAFEMQQKHGLIFWIACEIYSKLSDGLNPKAIKESSDYSQFKRPQDSWFCKVQTNWKESQDGRFFKILMQAKSLPAFSCEEIQFLNCRPQEIVDFCSKHLLKINSAKNEQLFISNSLRSIVIQKLIEYPEYVKNLLERCFVEPLFFSVAIEILLEVAAKLLEAKRVHESISLCEEFFVHLATSAKISRRRNSNLIWYFIELAYMKQLKHLYCENDTIALNDYLFADTFIASRLKRHAFGILQKNPKIISFEFNFTRLVLSHSSLSVDDFLLADQCFDDSLTEKLLQSVEIQQNNVHAFFEYIICKGKMKKDILLCVFCSSLGLHWCFVKSHTFFDSILDLVCFHNVELSEQITSIKKFLT